MANASTASAAAFDTLTAGRVPPLHVTNTGSTVRFVAVPRIHTPQRPTWRLNRESRQWERCHPGFGCLGAFRRPGPKVPNCAPTGKR